MFDPESEVGRRYLSYVENRARIWAEKYVDGREPDYRGDAILRRYHFCNVWRELDRYSRWEISQIRGRSLAEQVDVIVVGRMSMIPSTMRLLLAGAGRRDMDDYVESRRRMRVPWYNGAIQVSAYGGRDFIDEFLEHRDTYMMNRTRIVDAVRSARDASDIHAWLMREKPVYKVGAFRAYEIATSLTYSEHLCLDEASLFMVGPGAISSYNILTGSDLRQVSGGHDDVRLRPSFEALRSAVLRALESRGAMRWIPMSYQGSPVVRRRRKFTLRTLEDSLCEFRKYHSIISGSTRARRTYRTGELDV